MDATAQPQTVWIQLLGEFRVVSQGAEGTPPKFRSRTAERLLAFLALRLGQSVSRAELMDTLWPTSDGDRQSQNLRRALSDVRHALEDLAPESSLIHSQAERIWLDAENVGTDVAEFKSLTDAGFGASGGVDPLLRAIHLYRGPLLPSETEGGLPLHRMELEERFGQAVEQVIGHLLCEERHDEALRIGRQAVTAAPLREDVHMALTRAYASAGLKSEAIRQFEELEALLNEHWGEPPSPKSVRTFESLWADSGSSCPPPRTTAPPQTAGGAIPAGSPFYVERACDERLNRALDENEGTILIHGPRQVGKTSLLYRILGHRKQDALRIAVTDFQVLSRSQLTDGESLCRALAYGLATQLGSPLDLPGVWNPWIGPNSNLHAVVETLLRETDRRVVWALDEADRLFGTGLADDFFGLVRSWHNLRAMTPDGPFGRLSMVLSYATEAHLFIQDVNQSPFNVGIRISLRDFDATEVRELSHRYGLSMSVSEAESLRELTGGQPFLTRKALDTIVNEGATLEWLHANASEEDGPFGEHLKRLLLVATRDEATREELRRFLHGEPFADPQTALRLTAGGMLVRGGPESPRFRVPAYGEFLCRYLTSPASDRARP